jgi:arylformamidase
MRIIDISRTVSESLAVWPGDEDVRLRWTARAGADSVVNLGALSMSLHTGTHADAPLHFDSDGDPIDRVPLDRFMGPAQVIDVPPDADAIRPEHLGRIRAPRILFRTRHSRVPDPVWADTFPAVHPTVVPLLAGQGVILVGTDAPSVDPAASRTLDTHHLLGKSGIAILENLMLLSVEPGLYTLIALPLRLAGMDASPVRAVLTDLPGQ